VQLLTLGLGACFHPPQDRVLVDHGCLGALQLFPFIYEEGLDSSLGSSF
jgi:hypothetical protein